MSDRIAERRKNGYAAMSVARAARHPPGERVGRGRSIPAGGGPPRAVRLNRTSKPPDRSRGRLVTVNMHYGRYDTG